MRLLAVVCAMSAIASANGRPPATTSVFFRPSDTSGMNVATTFGLLVSPDGCRFYWLCENDVGFGGAFDPTYAQTPAGTLAATTFHGLRVSRNGGCSFTTATATLPANDPNNLSLRYIDALEVAPTGDVWIGTADSGSNNGVWHSTDDAMTFVQSGAATLPGTMWVKSIRVAPSNAQRMYVTTFEISGNMTPPSAHWFRSDDAGATWIEQSLAGVTLASSPIVMVSAVSPAAADTVFVLSPGGNGQGDRLYRSIDGGGALTDVLDTQYAITGIVARDAQRVVVATQFGGTFTSTDGGATFATVPSAPELACLGQRSDGVLFGCASNYDPDHMALARSDDGTTWTRVMSFEYLAGPLACPAGTVEHDVCDAQLWSSVAAQLGVVAATCASGPTVDAPAGDGTATKQGCCNAGDASNAWLTLAILVLARGTRIARRQRHDRILAAPDA